MKRIIILTLLILLSIPNVILASNCTVSMSEKIFFYDLDDISKYLSKRGLVDAYYSPSGSAIIHYYIGPSSIDSSAVAWTWREYPIVNKPSSDYYDVIRYYEN